VLKMMSKDLRIHAWRFKEDAAVTEAMLRFVVHTYRESKVSWAQDVLNGADMLGSRDNEEATETVEREFIFSLAHTLGVSCLSIFSESWQTFLSCHELQRLIVTVAPADNSDEDTTSTLAPELSTIIEEFYNSRLFHDDDSCLLLTKYLKSSDAQYARIIATILENAENYDAGALFHLAQLQAAHRPRRRDVMDTDIFAIITKAFENLRETSSPKILDLIDWMFSLCTSSRREPARSPFYTKMISLICKHARTHQDILLRVLQRIESQGSLMKHATAAELGLALVCGYRDHFVRRFRVCGHAAYAGIISAMQRARLECRHYVKNGEVVFDTEVIDVIRLSYHTKKKLMKLLSVDFPEQPKSTAS